MIQVNSSKIDLAKFCYLGEPIISTKFQPPKNKTEYDNDFAVDNNTSVDLLSDLSKTTGNKNHFKFYF